MNPTWILSGRILPLFSLAFAPSLMGQGIALTGGGIYTQNFDTLPAVTGISWVNDSTLPGWSAQTDTTPNPLPLNVYSGGGAALTGLLSMGLTGSTDRAFGFRPTTVNYGMTLLGLTARNTTAVPMTIGHVEFNGELWRTQEVASNPDGYQVFYQISDLAPATLGPFTVNNGATYDANAAVEDAGWIRIPALEYREVNAVAGGSLVTALTRTIAVPFMGVTLQPGQFLTFRWRNPNDTGGDAIMAIDDFAFGYSSVGASLVYNPAHSVGGGPNGVLTPSAQAYWTNGGVASGFAHGDHPIFSEAATATINVPANVVVSTLTVSAPAGVYTIGGLGRIEGALEKAGAGGLVLTSPNTFGTVTIHDGGKITTQGANALNTNFVVLTAGGTLEIGGDTTIYQAITGTGPFTKTGAGLLRLSGGAVPNTFAGATVVGGGTLEAAKTAGTNAIPGDLIIQTGGAFRYAGDTIGNQIADIGSITINGGSFGDPNVVVPVNPGAAETVASVTLNAGDFNTGRSAFTVTGDFTTTGGTARISRGGSLIAGKVTLGGTMNLDGGSSSAGQESRLTIGAGGLVLNGGTINLNFGPSALTAASQGSVITSGGNIVSTGNSAITRFNAGTVARAQFDFLGTDRTINVTGDLVIGSAQSPIAIFNGGIIKTGPGTLTLGGAQAYTQNTTVNGGKFLIDGSLASAVVTVAAGGTFGGNGAVTGALSIQHGGSLHPGLAAAGVLTAANLTFGAAPGDTATISFPTQASAALVVATPNAIVANGGPNSISVELRGAIPALGPQTIIDYEGVLGGAGFAAFKVGQLPSRVTAILSNDLNATTIVLNVTGVDQPRWTGAVSSEWSTATLADPKNWVLRDAGLPTDFLPSDFAVFEESSHPLVTINGTDVSPAETRFANPLTNYTLSGSKGISGTGMLVKEEAGSVTIENVNAFTGAVLLKGGLVKVASLTDGGVPGALGAGGSIILDGGALEISAPVTSTNRAWTANLAGGSLNIAGEVTLSGSISGTGNITKRGVGKLVLAGNNSGFNGRLTVAEGVASYSAQTIGGNGMTVTIDGGKLEHTDAVETVFNDGAALLRTLEIGAAGGTIHVANAAGAISLQRTGGAIGTGTVRKTGPGAVRMQVSNPSLSANWILDEGVLEAGAPDALGTGSVTVNAGMVATRNVTVNNNLTMLGGSLGTRTGDAGIFAGAVAINGAVDVFLRSYSTPAQPRTLAITGLLSGAADLRVEGNLPESGHYLLLANPANTYSGTFRVAPGQYLTSLSGAAGNPLGSGSVVLNDSGLALWADGIGDNGVITFPNPVTVTGAGVSRIDVDRAVGTFVGNTVEIGDLKIGAQTLLVTGLNQYRLGVNGTTTLSGNATFAPATADLIIRGDIAGNFGITKVGAGRLIVDGPTTFTGPANVQAGTFILNGVTTDGFDVLVGGGTFSGAGTVGGDVNFTGPSAFMPGNALRGFVQVDGNLSLHAASTVTFDLEHVTGLAPIAGTDYAQVVVGENLAGTGTVALNEAPLALVVSPSVQVNDLFFLILNDEADPVSGRFAGLDQGAVFSVGGRDFQISYTASNEGQAFLGGNDVAVQMIPEPGSLLLLAGGFVLCAASRRRFSREA